MSEATVASPASHSLTDRQRSWLALHLVEGVGGATVRKLLQTFGQIEAVMAASAKELQAQGLAAALAQKVAGALEAPLLAEEEALLAQYRIRLITQEDSEYPPLLLQTNVPPAVLYVRGRVPLGMTAGEVPGRPVLAVVGTRNPSRYGEKMTRQLIERLAQQVPDLVVVSGLARGVDTLAHQAALEHGLETVGVLGCGLSRVYPPENEPLAAKIANAHPPNGAIISEFRMKLPPNAAHFPIRNRVISGMSQGVLVVEAGQKSGALITVGFALNQGREVFALPGPIDHPASAGANRIIQTGQAKLVACAADILEELPGFERLAEERLKEPQTPLPAHKRGAKAQMAKPLAAAAQGQAPKGPPAPPKPPPPRPPAQNVTPSQAALLTNLQRGAAQTDQLAAELKVPVAQILSDLLELELMGEVVQTRDGRFERS